MVNPQSSSSPCKNVMTTIKWSPTITSIHYYIKRLSDQHKVWADFRVPESVMYVLVATQELVLCMICPHSPSGTVHPRVCAYTLGNALVPVLQLLLVLGCRRSNGSYYVKIKINQICLSTKLKHHYIIQHYIH